MKPKTPPRTARKRVDPRPEPLLHVCGGTRRSLDELTAGDPEAQDRVTEVMRILIEGARRLAENR